jgi:hypothetical protein
MTAYCSAATEIAFELMVVQLLSSLLEDLDDAGRNVLHYAVKMNRGPLVRILIAVGAELNIL